jgi:hypothetical protein
VLVLDMIEILSPLEKYKYDTWRILPVKCYIDNSVRLQSCIQNINKGMASLIHLVSLSMSLHLCCLESLALLHF